MKSFGQGIQRPGAGILDIHWLDENCLYTCGYDSYVHLWDHRTGNRVASWLEPHNSVLYCIQTDGLHSILCGTQRHGKVTLWDKRQRKSLQVKLWAGSTRLKTMLKNFIPLFYLSFLLN